MSPPSPSGEAVVLLMAVGSVLLVMCAIFIAFAVQKRRQRLKTQTKKPSGLSSLCLHDSSCVENPTDFMNNLASWDRSHPIEDIQEKRRRTAWTMEWFGSQSIKDPCHKNQDNASFNGVFQC